MEMTVSFKDFCELCEALGRTQSKLSKIQLIANFLHRIDEEDIDKVCYLLVGTFKPAWDSRELGISGRTIWKILREVSGASDREITKHYLDTGDLGAAAERLFSGKKSLVAFFGGDSLTIDDVFSTLNRIADQTGEGSHKRKENLLKGLLARATPLEAKYIVRIVLSNMLTGVNEGLLEEAIARGFRISSDLVRRAHMISNDIGLVARIARKEGARGLESIRIKPFRPVKPMLALQAESIKQALDELGKAAFEFKYDGARIQAHFEDGRIELFTRRMEKATHALPELARAIPEAVDARSFILDGEAVAYDPESGKPKPFQQLLRRVRRKRNVYDYLEEIPIIYHPFDILYLNGEDLTRKPLEERREILERVIQNTERVELGPFEIVEDPEIGEKFFRRARELGHEGVMIKDLGADYAPGSRGKRMFKYKETLDTLDLVIIAAEWGEGRKHKWLSRYLLGAWNEDRTELVLVGRVAYGLTDDETKELTERLKDLIVEDRGKMVIVEPKIVLEVAFEEIQKSPNYPSGYALRFPRVVAIRYDLGPEDADSLDRIKRLYEMQQARKSLS